MFAVPALTPVTTPVLETVAIVASLLLQLPPVTVAVRDSDEPAQTAPEPLIVPAEPAPLPIVTVAVVLAEPHALVTV